MVDETLTDAGAKSLALSGGMVYGAAEPLCLALLVWA
jgi:hypothetical protein